MEKKTVKKVASILALFVATACISVFFRGRSMLQYDYEVGQKWPYETLYAEFSFPILKTDDQVQEELNKLSSEFIPYYKFSRNVTEESLAALESLDLTPSARSAVSFLMEEIFEKGIIDTKRAEYIYVQKDKRALKYPSDEFYSISQAKLVLAQQVGSIVAACPDILDLVRPNLVFDEKLSNLVQNDAKSSISYTDGYVEAGRMIIRQNEVITPELFQLLESYRKEYDNNGLTISAGWSGVSGYSIVIFVILCVLYLVIRMVDHQLVGTKAYYYILLIFVVFTIAEIVMASRIDESYLLMFPFTLTALLLQAFFSPKLVIPVYLVTLMPVLLLSHFGYAFYAMFATVGIVSIRFFPYFSKGWRQFLLALIIFLILLALTLPSAATTSISSLSLSRRILFLFIGSVLTVAGYPLVYLFEKIFNFVSNSRLVELGDTSNPLLRKLEVKAPGTFQHSLQVMNMADFAARAIDANPLLVRAGALYHDIGKMNNPLCFVENESLHSSESENKYHSSLTPVQSAQDIIKHVTDGVEIARENHLPDVVTEFILSHHGTAPVKFFYTKFLNDGGSENDLPLFCYNGIKPRSREQVILMFCDVIEAASRSLKEHSPESYSQFVHSVISGKLHDGQLDDAEISIRELGILEDSLKTYLAQMHHERIDYPKRKKIIND